MMSKQIWDKDLSVINMSDIDVQTLDGALATSTHGTGLYLGSMSSDATGYELVSGKGELLRVSEESNADYFHALGNSLGCLGVMTKIQMQCEPSYNLREDVWAVKLDEAFERMEEWRDNNRHFELFALPHCDYAIPITLNKSDKSIPAIQPETSDAYEAFRLLAKIVDVLPFMKTTIMNIGASTVEPETRIGPSASVFGNLRDILFNEMEYTVAAEDGPQCLREILDTIRKQNINVIFPIEYRYVKADNIWLSPFYKRDGCSISCHNFHDKDYKKYFAAIEPIFWKYGGRPHWGKLHSLGAKQMAALYPKFSEFKRVRKELDPQGRFENAFTRSIFST